jgi:hypothetical protein
LSDLLIAILPGAVLVAVEPSLEAVVPTVVEQADDFLTQWVQRRQERSVALPSRDEPAAHAPP